MVATIEHFVKKGPPRMGERQAGKTLPPNAGHANFRHTHFRGYFGSYTGRESPENYGLNVDNDFGLCRITWNSRNYQCEHGKDCPWRHFITSNIIEYIWRMAGRKGLDWLVSSMTALRAPGRVEHTYIPLPQGKSRRFDDGEGEDDGYSVSRPMHKRVKYGHGGW